MPYIDLETLPEAEPIPGLHVRFVHSEHMTLAYWRIDAGADLPVHSHPHEQVATLTEGELEMTVGGETRRLTPGIAAVIPSGVPHSARAITQCRLLDVFYPVREDFRS